LLPNRLDAAGTWHALLTIGKPRLTREDAAGAASSEILRGLFAAPKRARTRPVRGAHLQRASVLAAERAGAGRVAAIGAASPASTSRLRTLPYSVVVHAYSSVSLRAHAEQSGFEPGARIVVAATLAQSGIPMTRDGAAWADVTSPDGGAFTVAMQAHGEGPFMGSFAATMPGVYRIRVRARGTTQRGEPFTREKTLTAAVWRGGDRPGSGVPGGTGGGMSPGFCEILECLFGADGALGPEAVARMKALGIDVPRLRKCLEGACREDGHGR
jgi:hypothetical protein